MILALKNILFTLVVPGTVGVYLPLILVRGRNPATDFFLGLAIIFFVIGGSIFSLCLFGFFSFGGGAPAPIDAPKKLVRRRLSSFSRNPMYVGVLTVIYGWTILYQSIPVAVYGIVVAGCFYSFVVFFEEPILKKRFGTEYEQYCAEVPRWLFV